MSAHGSRKRPVNVQVSVAWKPLTLSVRDLTMLCPYTETVTYTQDPESGKLVETARQPDVSRSLQQALPSIC